MHMRTRATALTTAMLAFAFLTASIAAQEQKGQKGERKRQAGEKVEMKDVPAQVLAAAKKEAPKANFTAAEKITARKKVGTVYSVEGKEGKYQVVVQVDSSGDLVRLTKAVERKRKKATK